LGLPERLINLRQNSTADDFLLYLYAELNDLLKPCIKYGFQPNAVAKGVNLISRGGRPWALALLVAPIVSRIASSEGAHNGCVRTKEPQPENRHCSILLWRILITLLTAATLSTGCRPGILAVRARRRRASIEFYPNPNKLKALLR